MMVRLVRWWNGVAISNLLGGHGFSAIDEDKDRNAGAAKAGLRLVVWAPLRFTPPVKPSRTLKVLRVCI